MGLALISILGRDGPPSTEPDSSAAPLSWALRELGSLDRHSTMDRARNPRSPSPPPSPICRGSGMAVPSPICRGSGVHPHRHPRFARIGDTAEYH